MAKTTARPLIGAHLSTVGGATKLLTRAKELGVETLQIHPSAPQNFRQSAISPEDRAQIKKVLATRQVPLYFHSIYLINLANEDDRLWHASLGSVENYLTEAVEFGAIGTITHVGSHKGRGLAAVKERLTAAAKKLAAETPQPRGIFIIENTAGGGGTLGRDIKELAVLYKIFSDEIETKVCVDTCHLYASGVDLNNEKVWQEWLAEFDTKIGLKNLVAIHLNDSKGDLGGNRDRHANLGEGKIGLVGLARVINEPKLAHCHFILEVPGTGHGPDLDNIERAQSLRK